MKLPCNEEERKFLLKLCERAKFASENRPGFIDNKPEIEKIGDLIYKLKNLKYMKDKPDDAV